MILNTIHYNDYITQIPKTGKVILGQQTSEHILVYQAFRKSIADQALQNQTFGGGGYSFERMSWIKPNFLWMMYRSGWGTKLGQEKILGIWLKKIDFDKILTQSVHSSYHEEIYSNHNQWKSKLLSHPVRLQWDPDHDPYGKKQERKAIQLGIKGHLLREFSEQMICKIVDMSSFVENQRGKVESRNLTDLIVPFEEEYIPSTFEIQSQIGISLQRHTISQL